MSRSGPTRPLVGATALVAALLSALVGCGDGSSADAAAPPVPDRSWVEEHPPHELVSTALLALQHESSIRITADMGKGREKTHYDMTVLDYDNCFGHLSGPHGLELDLVGKKGDGWQRGSARTYRALSRLVGVDAGVFASAARQLAGKWLHADAINQTCHLFNLFRMLNSFSARYLGEMDEVDGHEAVTVAVYWTPDMHADAIMWIDLAEPHHVLRTTIASTNEPRLYPSFLPGFSDVDARFSDFDAVDSVPTPPKADWIEPEDVLPGVTA